MGGPFSAQSADLRSVWGAKKRTDLMRQLESLNFSPRGHPLWTTPRGNTLSLAQFRDNVLVGAKGPTAQREMQSVCDVLSQVWNLPVLCDCVASSLTGMGFTMHLGTHNPPPDLCTTVGFVSGLVTEVLCHSATPTAQAYKHISSILVSAVLNVQPFLHTWASCLLSITSWAQIACLSGYARPTVLRTLHSAVPRIVARTPWDLEKTLAWCQHVAYILPSTRDTILFRLHRWLQTNAEWSSGAYASWHMPHIGQCSAQCADWCYDFPILAAPTPLLNPCIKIPVGPSPWGEGAARFPIVCIRTQERVE